MNYFFRKYMKAQTHKKEEEEEKALSQFAIIIIKHSALPDISLYTIQYTSLIIEMLVCTMCKEEFLDGSSSLNSDDSN